MDVSRRAFLGVTAWMGGISALHSYLNVNWTALRNHLRSRDKLETLVVAGLPVTCNLTLPIACEARNLDTTVTGANFDYRRYNGWPEVKESLISGQVDAAYMLVPLVMSVYFSVIRFNLMQPDQTGFIGLENFEYFLTDPSFSVAVAGS